VPEVDRVPRFVSRGARGGDPSGCFLFRAVLRDGRTEQLFLVLPETPATVDVELDPVTRVLLVEDEPYLAEAIRDGLRLAAIAGPPTHRRRCTAGATDVRLRFDPLLLTTRACSQGGADDARTRTHRRSDEFCCLDSFYALDTSYRIDRQTEKESAMSESPGLLEPDPALRRLDLSSAVGA
jgi:hypothetical protein